MIRREMLHSVQQALLENPAVALLGPRQVGKTTLALEIAEQQPAVYLDLQNPRDLAKARDIELFYESHADKLIILDEVQCVPELFASLRGLIDRERRAGRRTGLFLLLGSASMQLMKQTSESLAGRIRHIELTALTVLEVQAEHGRATTLWSRGGFPESFLSPDDGQSLRWRQDFIRTYLERDIPQLGPRIPAETLRRFWTMLAHQQAGMLNQASLAQGLGISGQSVSRYLDLMVDLLLVRRLPPWAGNAGKRLVKAPKVMVRDSGLAHALLDIGSYHDLLGHPVVGASWEAFVIENLLSVLPPQANACFYRSPGGAEMDLVLEFNSNERWAIEIKHSSAPSVTRGFHVALADINPSHSFIVYPGQERWLLRSQSSQFTSEVIGLSALMQRLRNS